MRKAVQYGGSRFETQQAHHLAALRLVARRERSTDSIPARYSACTEEGQERIRELNRDPESDDG